MVPRYPGYMYGSDGVRLLCKTQRKMTWGMWGIVLKGLRMFEETWEFVGFEFDVWDGEVESEDTVGSGHLWEVE